MIRLRTFLFLFALNFSVVFIILYNITPTQTSRPSHENDGKLEINVRKKNEIVESQVEKNEKERDVESEHELCVIVPYRDRLEELSQFSPYIQSFLLKQNIRHQILVINQTDEYRFNRASLINVGWLESRRLGCSYMVMHDVDLLPVNPNIDYGYPGNGTVRHISSAQYHPKYNYTKFIGGILMLTMEDYRLIDGMSNKYWGWGLEDDEFYLRIKEGNLNLTRTSGLTTDKKTTFRHIHPTQRKRDYAVVTKNQREMKRKRDRISGLHNVKYGISGRRLVHFGLSTVRLIDVQLECDLKWTPYCILPKQKSV